MIKFITTFAKTGYDVYGKYWIDSFITNTSSPDITAEIYVDFPLESPDARIKIVDYNSAIPEHAVWAKEFDAKSKHHHYGKLATLKFSYKSFVMAHVLTNTTAGYVIWLDGDAEIIADDFVNFPQMLLDSKFIAVQKEADGDTFHCESGVVIFDATHPAKDAFAAELLNQYLSIDNLDSMARAFDGFIIWRSILANNIDCVDLNLGYGNPGIQSDPNCTFLNPELKKRFVHNIGPTGKRGYDNWDQYKDVDPFFNLVENFWRFIKPRTQDEIARVADKKSKLLNKKYS